MVTGLFPTVRDIFIDLLMPQQGKIEDILDSITEKEQDAYKRHKILQ